MADHSSWRDTQRGTVFFERVGLRSLRVLPRVTRQSAGTHALGCYSLNLCSLFRVKWVFDCVFVLRSLKKSEKWPKNGERLENSKENLFFSKYTEEFYESIEVYVYSLKVWLHFVQRKNCVDASSPPRVCTCQT
mgnify:CR=1 FL=1